jgi:glycosyltransferase involved in cell wall biosynthesis
MSYRPYYLCQEFQRNQLKAYVIGASFHHLKHTNQAQKNPLDLSCIDGQDFIFIKTPSYQGNGYQRVRNMFSFAWNLWRHQKKIVAMTGKPDVIIASSVHPLHFVPARRIAKKYGAKLIFEVRDLWPLSLIDVLGLSRWHPFVVLLSAIEKSAYKNADTVVSLLPNAFSYMQERGLSQERFVTIPNGVAVSAILADRQPLPPSYQKKLQHYKGLGKFLLGYAGAHGIPNALEDLLQAMRLLKEEGFDKVQLLMIGKGNQKQQLMDFAKQHQLASVSFLDPLPKNQVYGFLEQMDALYLGWKKRGLYQYGISPNKIFDYLLAAKPIVHASATPLDLVAQTKAGICVEAADVGAIAQAIRHIASLEPKKLMEMGERGRREVLTHYAYSHLAKKYISLFPSPGVRDEPNKFEETNRCAV